MTQKRPHQDTAKKELYNAIKEQILTLQLAPDAALEEMGLSKKYNLSRTPVREVLRHLAADGYLVIKPNRGAFVAPMDKERIQKFFQTAPKIYALIAKDAAQNHTNEQLTALKNTQHKFSQAIKKQHHKQCAFYNNQFHLMMGQMAHNPYIFPSFQLLLVDHARIGYLFFQHNKQDMEPKQQIACNHHDDFIAALSTRNSEKAVEITYAHWALSQERMDLFIL